MLSKKSVLPLYSQISTAVLEVLHVESRDSDEESRSLDDDDGDRPRSNSPTVIPPVGFGIRRSPKALALPLDIPISISISLTFPVPDAKNTPITTSTVDGEKTTFFPVTQSTTLTTSTTTTSLSTLPTPPNLAPLAFSTIGSLPTFTLATFSSTTTPSTTSLASTFSPIAGVISSTTRIAISTTQSSPSIYSTATPTSTMSTSTDEGANNRTLIITLSSVLSVVGVVVVVISAYLCFRSRRRRLKLFNRGITPINDDEIATWKLNKPANEKAPQRFTRSNSNKSSYAHRREMSNSLIQYQSHAGPSPETSPQSFIPKQSFDFPRIPQSALVAIAPNARSGLTDETIPGDDPFVTLPKRHPSKLSKLPPNSPQGHRARSSRGSRVSRSSSVKSFADAWYGDNMPLSPRTSNDATTISSHGPPRIYSTSTAPPQLSSGDSELFTGLSPPPLHRTEIGRALG